MIQISSYEKHDARAWARENLIRTCSVTYPTFTTDLTKINEAAVRHDIELAIEHGYEYTLLLAETAITVEEYGRFTAVARETAGDRLKLFAHTAFGTVAENIAAMDVAEKEGADLILLAYPPQFWPTSEQEVYDWTKSICDATNLGAMLFPIPLWGFERIHPAGMSVDFVRKVLDTIPNIVAIKSEQGFPTIGGLCEMYHHFREEVVISCPIESDAIPIMSLMDLQFSGTSPTEYMSNYYPRAFDLAREGKFEEAMELFWQVSPARGAGGAAHGSYVGGTSVLNRTMLKYQAWLAGYNGGPLRAPAMRAPDRIMKSLRGGLEASNLPVTDSPDSEYMIGRNPA